jgi:hypothetical protein
LFLEFGDFDFVGSGNVDKFVFEVLGEITLLSELHGQALVGFLDLGIAQAFELLGLLF